MQQIYRRTPMPKTLLKSHFGMGVLLYICCIFSEYFFTKNTSGWLLLFLTSGKIIIRYENRIYNTYSIVKYFGSKQDVYTTSADLCRRWCFISSFQISSNTKKTLLEIHLYKLHFLLCFRAKYILYHIQKIKKKEFCFHCQAFLILFIFHAPSFSMSFLYLLLCEEFLGSSHLFCDSFFIFKENTSVDILIL